MADQAIPTGGLAPGLTSAVLLATAPRPVPDKPRSAKVADPPSRDPGVSSKPDSPKLPEAAAEVINSRLQQMATGLRIHVDGATGRTVFKVVNEQSGAVLFQVPSDELLALARNLLAQQEKQGASGVLIDREG